MKIINPIALARLWLAGFVCFARSGRALAWQQPPRRSCRSGAPIQAPINRACELSSKRARTCRLPGRKRRPNTGEGGGEERRLEIGSSSWRRRDAICAAAATVAPRRKTERLLIDFSPANPPFASTRFRRAKSGRFAGERAARWDPFPTWKRLPVCHKMVYEFTAQAKSSHAEVGLVSAFAAGQQAEREREVGCNLV